MSKLVLDSTVIAELKELSVAHGRNLVEELYEQPFVKIELRES